MRKILLILFVLISFVSSAQKLQFDNTYGREFQRVQVDTLLGLPKDTFLVPATLQNVPFIANKAGSIYLWNISTHVWDLFSSGGSYTDADARAAISLTTTGTSGAATYSSATGVFNIPVYAAGSISQNWFDDDLTLNGVTTKINRADFFDDMLTTPTSTAGTSYMLELVSGTGADASIGNTAGTPPDGSGWSVLSTGTTSTGAAGLASTSGTISKLKVDTTKTYRFETKINIETLSDDTEDFRIVAGFCTWTANTTGTNLIWFRYNDNTNSGNWTCYSADGATTESTNSGIAAAAGTSVTLAFEYDNAAIRYYINGSLVATHTTRLPQHDASTSYPVISVTKTLGSTARLIYFDYVKYRRL